MSYQSQTRLQGEHPPARTVFSCSGVSGAPITQLREYCYLKVRLFLVCVRGHIIMGQFVQCRVSLLTCFRADVLCELLQWKLQGYCFDRAGAFCGRLTLMVAKLSTAFLRSFSHSGKDLFLSACLMYYKNIMWKPCN